MWAYESVFYQIYPIGFCGAPTENDGVTVPRIRKLMDWTDYLKSLGISAVLLNPIFESDNHGYDTRNFLKIDCRLGTNKDFSDVCSHLHQHGIRIVLDGVFNHVGRGFWAFQDVKEKKWGSPYKDWFYLNFDGDSAYQDGFWYEGWEGHFELVKLNLQNPAVVDYLLSCVQKWITEFDIDGLRLDVAYSLDRNFMHRLRNFCAELKPDFALIGEVLFGDYNLIVNDELLHSCTNYECYKGLYSSFNDRMIVILNEEVRQHMRTREATRLVKGNGQRTVACTDPQYVVLEGRMSSGEFQERPANTAALMRRIDGKTLHLGNAKTPFINTLIRHDHAPERAIEHKCGACLGTGLILRIRREHLASAEVKLDHVPLLVGEQQQVAISLAVAVDRLDAHCQRHALLQRARMDSCRHSIVRRARTRRHGPDARD